ncbi:MAG TPA: hypothetical protein VID48_12830 [Solirubrobacteraceae bacterium]|jgi:hypothetical protein
MGWKLEFVAVARIELSKRGVQVSEIQVFDRGSSVFFSDPDGNGFSVAQLPLRD